VVASPPGVTAGSALLPSRLTVLRCPPPLCPHLEFALSAELEQPIGLRWGAQSSAPGDLTATVELPGAPGMAGRVAARLRRLGPVTFEIVEASSVGADAERYSYTPDLGLFRASLAANGDIVVGEGQLRALLLASHDDRTAAATLAHGLERLLGTAWDEELEPLRRGGEQAPVSWFRRTG
jgi:hypothetical protein